MEQGELNDNDEKLVFLVKRPELEKKHDEEDESTALPGIQLEDEDNMHEE